MTIKEKAKRYDELMEALAFWRDYYRQAKEEAVKAASFENLSELIRISAKKEAYESIIDTLELERMMGIESQ